MRVPRAWMAKSTMVVVPPKAAARVPVSKSSRDVVPPKGMSRCVWASMPPGITYMPVASITLLGGRAPGCRPDLVNALAFDQDVGAFCVSCAVTTVPLRMSVFMLGCYLRVRCPSIPCGLPVIDLLHGDAALHRADQPAEVAAHAFLFIHVRDALRRRFGVGVGMRIAAWRWA